MKALVTGGTGFVGSHLIDRLIAEGDEVTALVRSPARAAGLGECGVRLVPGDLHDAEAMRQAAAGQDVVYHVAALVGARTEVELVHANRDGTANLVAAVEDRSPGARFVLVSSLAAAGASERGRPRDAGAAPAPVTMYGRSKLASEAVVRSSRLSWVIVRPPAVYGPRDRDNFLALFRLARFRVCPIFGDGTQELSLVYVTDLAAALRQAASSEGSVGQAYFVNHPELVTSGQLLRQIGELVGARVRLIPLPRAIATTALGIASGVAGLLNRKTILHPDKVHEFYQPAWTSDPGPLIRNTGWVPEFDLARGLGATLGWYREQGWL